MNSSIASTGNYHIVLVSTDRQDIRQLGSYFEHSGSTVEVCATASEVIGKDFSGINLVLIEMSDDVDGCMRHIEAIRQSAIWSQTAILVFSSITRSDVLVKALNAGADDYLIKPFSMRELTARINAVLRAARRG